MRRLGRHAGSLPGIGAARGRRAISSISGDYLDVGPERARPAGAGLGRIITTYRSMIEVCRDRANELQISRLEIDRISGLPEGYSGKILGWEGDAPRKKRLWPVALKTMPATLGLKDPAH
jgi:hypothetical protein